MESSIKDHILEALTDTEVEFTFTKKDGSTRVLKGNRDSELEYTPDWVNVYEPTEGNQVRCIRWDSISRATTNDSVIYASSQAA